jgi:isoquinoline 1-oxidoreductase beta subunit
MSLAPSLSIASSAPVPLDHMEIAEAIEAGLSAVRMQSGSNKLDVSRRDFLKLGTLVCGGFVLGMPLRADANGVTASEAGQLNHFIHVGIDGRITIFAANPELGQGVKTSIPMIAAEELGARWSDVKVVQSPIDESKYGRHYAGGSTTTPRCFDQMRQVGAAARSMLISAAAQKLNAPANEFTTRDSLVIHTPSNRQLKFADLAALAAKQPAPAVSSLKFKDRKDYTLIGTAVTGVDNRAVVTGQPLFGSDVQVPGMLYAAYQKCPAVFGTVKSANLDAIKKLPGVVDAFVIDGNGKVDQLLSGVAIVGKSTWAVFSAKKQLQVVWDETNASKDSWTDLSKRAQALNGKQGKDVVAKVGDVDAAFANASNKTVSAFYTYPFAYHACMEPMTCTAHVKESAGKKHLEVWAPSQAPERIFTAAESVFGYAKNDVTVHQMRAGGAFGRRGSTEFTCEAIAISQRVKAPVKLTWTREDDLEHDYFRVGGFQSLKGAVDQNGKLAAWDQHVIGMSVQGQPVRGFNFGATEFPLLNLKTARGTRTMFEIKTPCGPWRAPGANTMSWAVQSFIHELAHAAGRDHLEFLLEIMGEPRWFRPGEIRSLNTGRAANVIKLAAEKAGWGKSLPKGRGMGLAFHFSHGAPVAEVAEVSVDANKKITIHKITVATDVGPIINMSGAINQIQGSVIDGLSTMLGLEITMENGRMQQSNFHQYPMLRMKHAPQVEAHFIQSDNPPTGLGEPALPPLAPAIGNAIFAATGHRIRTMPISKEGYSV